MKNLYKFLNIFSKWKSKSPEEKINIIILKLMSNKVFLIDDIVSYDIDVKEGFIVYQYRKSLTNFNYTYTKIIYKPLTDLDLLVFDHIWTIIQELKQQPNDLDTILDKISDHGVNSLNVKEIKYLEEYEKNN
jgi:hypothetical protein